MRRGIFFWEYGLPGIGFRGWKFARWNLSNRRKKMLELLAFVVGGFALACIIKIAISEIERRNWIRSDALGTLWRILIHPGDLRFFQGDLLIQMNNIHNAIYFRNNLFINLDGLGERNSPCWVSKRSLELCLNMVWGCGKHQFDSSLRSLSMLFKELISSGIPRDIAQLIGDYTTKSRWVPHTTQTLQFEIKFPTLKEPWCWCPDVKWRIIHDCWFGLEENIDGFCLNASTVTGFNNYILYYLKNNLSNKYPSDQLARSAWTAYIPIHLVPPVINSQELPNGFDRKRYDCKRTFTWNMQSFSSFVTVKNDPKNTQLPYPQGQIRVKLLDDNGKLLWYTSIDQ